MNSKFDIYNIFIVLLMFCFINISLYFPVSFFLRVFAAKQYDKIIVR
jgi:hypothetical protein